jgi:hypothetical protein
MPLSSLIAIAILKQFLILSKIFSNTRLHEVGSYLIISEISFLEEFCFEKTGIAKEGTTRTRIGF